MDEKRWIIFEVVLYSEYLEGTIALLKLLKYK